MNLQTPDQIVSIMLGEPSVETCKALSDSGWWNLFSKEQAAFLQFHQRKLCMPFDIFHEYFESLIGRPVFTHEFVSKRLLEEELATGIHPSLNEILAQIPPDKMIVFNPDEV